jgi:hypothetical protein
MFLSRIFAANFEHYSYISLALKAKNITFTRKEEKLAGKSTGDAIRRRPKQLSYYQTIGRRDPKPRRRWLDGLMFEDVTD